MAFLERPSEPDVALGTALLKRVYVASWMHRRVDTFRFVGPTGIRQKISFDLEVSSDATVEKDGSNRKECIVPLLFVKKSQDADDMEMLRDLDVRDELGSTLAALGRRENAEAAWAMLCVAAVIVHPDKTTSGVTLSSVEKDRLWEVVAESAGEAGNAARTSIEAAEAPPGGWESEYARLNAVLLRPGFRYLFEKLASTYLFCVVVDDPGSGQRRSVIKVACDADFAATTEHSSRWRLWTSRLGLREVPVTLVVREPLATMSLHVAVEDPGDLFDAELRERGRGRTSVSTVRHDNKLAEKRMAHLHAGRIGADREVFVLLRLAVSFGQLIPALGSLLALTAMLFVFSRSAKHIAVGTDASVALLLLIPGVAVGIFAARKQHHFAAQVLRPLRLVMGAASLLALAAGIAVIVVPRRSAAHVSSNGLDDWLLAFAALSALLTFYLVWAASIREATRRRLAKSRT